jgi:hypothetical protein
MFKSILAIVAISSLVGNQIQLQTALNRIENRLQTTCIQDKDYPPSIICRNASGQTVGLF